MYCAILISIVLWALPIKCGKNTQIYFTVNSNIIRLFTYKLLELQVWKQ